MDVQLVKDLDKVNESIVNCTNPVELQLLHSKKVVIIQHLIPISYIYMNHILSNKYIHLLINTGEDLFETSKDLKLIIEDYDDDFSYVCYENKNYTINVEYISGIYYLRIIQLNYEIIVQISVEDLQYKLLKPKSSFIPIKFI